MRQREAMCAVGGFEVVGVFCGGGGGGGGAGVTTQVAGWQKLHEHRDPREKDSQIKFRMSATRRFSLWRGLLF